MVHRILSLLILVLFAGSATAQAADDPWAPVAAIEQKREAIEAELRQIDGVLELHRQIAGQADAKVAAARTALAEAEQALEQAHTEAGLDELRQKLRDAQAKRDAAATQLLAASPQGNALVEQQETLQQRVSELEARLADLNEDELQELAQAQQDLRRIDRQLYHLRRALWERGEVVNHYRTADRLYKAYGRERRSAKAVGEAEKQVKQARGDVEKALANVAIEGTAESQLLARRAELSEQSAQLDAGARQIRRQMFEGARTVELMVDMPDKRGKPQEPEKVSLWIPPNCDYIRGVVIASGQVKSFATGDRLRAAAMQAGLATMYMPNMSFDGKESWQRLDELLPRLAEASGHEELKGAPILTAGLSASVLATRNFAYERPDRMIGTVQIAGGNMHHKIMDASQSLSGVPFLAINGELEWCGPEGGIRPEYGRQTQWLMLREQLLRRRRADPNHLMSFVVVPGGDHGHWDRDLAALFLMKAAEYRISDGRRDGSTPARCIELTAKDGWLTDADLDHPQHRPAPWDQYAGDKTEAFWHLDRQMAEAVRDYHQGRFILPDPTKQAPVPSDWPK